ncbi:MAG: TetR/AcrR family transcriptional regulator [Bacilli bacterium]
METNKGEKVSMNDIIIDLTLKHLKEDGLKFSIDEIAKELKISKKTIYKYFSSKEILANSVFNKITNITLLDLNKCLESSPIDKHKVLEIYLSSFILLDERLFNRFSLNESVKVVANKRHQQINEMMNNSFIKDESILFIIESTFKSLYSYRNDKNIVEKTIERLILLWV